ncbi:BZ3500_MvSof-1268-A1-R1_C104g00572 [Microbotryum saponariae]|uniref:BZ3500_MvSof-1268-A1-R1_C104g00572 protein n=1 Tax=Microbotryum saponariae TaxID=289078 RepID=A0A2X0N3Q4_9BASI|nr:BZ3500_MvSof-1268-A1-R1_C104g00572 [Microbotryum saponariae]
MADERDVYAPPPMIETLLSATKTPAARNRPSPRAQPYHTATALSSLESRLEESEARRIDSEARVQQLEKLVEGLLKSSPEPAAARAGVSEPAVARAGFSEPAAARAGEFTFPPVRSVPLDVPHTPFWNIQAIPLTPCSFPGGESHSARRDGPSSAVISSRWRGTLPDREGLWTGDNPDRLVTFTTFGKSYLSLLCDISTSDLFTTDRVIQLVATLFVRSTSPKRRQSPHDWAVDTMTDALRDERPHCWTTLMTEVGRPYDHVGEWRARYRAFMHNDPSFSLSSLQLATTFYQSLSDVAKREVRAGMLREYRDNSLVTIGRFGRTVPSLEEFSTPPIRTATYGAIAKTPRTAPSTPNDDARTQIRRARWMNRAGKWQQAHLWKDRNTWFSPASGGVPASMACFNCGQGGHFSQHCTAERQSPRPSKYQQLPSPTWTRTNGRRPQTDLTRPSSSASALVTHHSCPPADLVGRVKDVASSSFEVQTSSSSSHPTVPANDADQHRFDDSLADIAIDAVEDVLYYADAASRLCHYPGPEVVSSRKAERTASVSSFQILVRRRSTWWIRRWCESTELRNGRLTAPLHLRLGTQDKSDRCAVFATAPFSSGALDLGLRPFFVCRVTAYDAILGLPFLKDTGMLVGWGVFTVARTGPSQPVAQDTHEWDRAVTVAPILSSSAIGCNHPGLLPDDEIIGLEPHNPLLDVVDDPALDDFSESEARTRLAALLEKFSDVFVDSLPMDQLPPYRPVNHEIPLIDPPKRSNPGYTPCRQYRSQWAEHSAKYTRGRFWVSGPIDSAAPVFAIPKKNSQTARFVIDLRARNSNTVKRFSPIPDMTNVPYEVARSRSVIPEHVDRTGFATVTGTYTSRVMQFGDTNAPIPQPLDLGDVPAVSPVRQDLFRRCPRPFRYPSCALETHQDPADDIETLPVLLRIQEVEWFSKSLDSLGTIISDVGIEVDPAKWVRIRQWPIPCNKTDVQRFLGTVNWMRDHLPHLSKILEPITALMAQATSWRWNEREQQAFDTVKSLVPAILRPIDGAKVTSGEHKMYLFTDASRVGIGACLASGPTVRRPFQRDSFPLSSTVLSSTIMSLIKSPSHDKTQKLRQTPRHIRMCLELSRFDFEFEFIAGKNNTLADSLSRLWEVKQGSHEDQVKENELEDMFFDGERHEFTTPGESLLEERPYTSPSHDRLPLLIAPSGLGTLWTPSIGLSAASLLPSLSIEFTLLLRPCQRPAHSGPCDADELDLLGVATDDVNDTPVVHRPPDPLPQPFLDTVIRAYANDSQAQVIITDPLSWPMFRVTEEGRILRVHPDESISLFVPRGLATGVVNSDKVPSLRELVLSEIHRSVGHAGHRITLAAIRPLYWWSSMSADCAEFCRSCEDCTEARRPLKSLWPTASDADPFWSLGTSGHRLHDRTASGRARRDDGCSNHGADADSELVAEKYYATVFRLHGMPSAIVSDRDPKFTSQFWRALQAKIGTVLRMSTAAHPETDGSSENRIKMVTQPCGSWSRQTTRLGHLVLLKLSNLRLPPRCWPSDSWSVSDVPRAEAFARIRQLRNLDVTDAIIGARLNQSHQANKHRRPDDPAFRTGSYVYLSTKNLAVPDGMKSKLLPRYIGPFRIRAAIPATSSYDLELPPAMSRVHNRFHARLLRPCVENDAERFPGRDPAVLFVEDVADAADNSAIPERIVRDRRNARGARSFLVRWVGRNDTDDTWMSEQSIHLDHPSVLDAYLARLDRSNRRLAAR